MCATIKPCKKSKKKELSVNKTGELAEEHDSYFTNGEGTQEKLGEEQQ